RSRRAVIMFFLFQAEDGIRARNVTGIQTCALPIYYKITYYTIGGIEMEKLQNKVAIITGGAAGMGEAHVRLFIKEGAKVVLTDVNTEKGQALADELGESAHFIQHDVTDEAGWEKVVHQTEEKIGPVNILVNNAGISPVLSVENSSLEDYMNVVQINQVSVFLG